MFVTLSWIYVMRAQMASFTVLCAGLNKRADVDFHAVMSVTEIELLLIGQTERTSRAESPTHRRRNLSTN